GFFLLISLLCVQLQAVAQCPSPIASFPYNEGFETSDGGFTVHGNLSTWAWGAPAKPVITNASGGAGNCWVTGGLTGGAYNDAEASWIESPCFNFTTLPFPYLSMDLWWETEGRFDGMAIQYTINNGASWVNVDNGNPDCLDSNWYNNTASYLSVFGAGSGWSGNIQSGGGGCVNGGGSGGWVRVKKALPQLGGQANVAFRFLFAAGTQCNAFDGVGIDNLRIENAPPNTGSISFTCSGPNTRFTYNTTMCPTQIIWDFNDAITGALNIGNGAEVQHNFSAPGNYLVSVTATGPGNAAFTTQQLVTVLGARLQVTQPLGCSGAANAQITVTPNGGFGTLPYTYLWNTNPAQTTATAVGLGAGTYSVIVDQPGACSAEDSITLVAPQFIISDTVQQPGCLFAAGRIAVQVSGAIYPYRYQWQPAVSTDSIAGNLAPGNYQLQITDARGCSELRNYSIVQLPKPIVIFTGSTVADCNGRVLGTAVARAFGTLPPYQFSWNTLPVQLTDTATNLLPGTYTVTVTDGNGCTQQNSIQIVEGGVCNSIYFPTAFSPNGDGNNEQFGALGNLLKVTDYYFAVFNRYGQILFSTNQPQQQWNGLYNGIRQLPGTYVWVARYRYNGGALRNYKGSFVLMR
ncbi:MAG: hypothetical protein RLY16_1767, partial [Bacteroidota bacterium]